MEDMLEKKDQVQENLLDKEEAVKEPAEGGDQL
jgi:hypothetical protein